MIDVAFVSYVGVMSVTPGPNNLLLATSGVRFGMARTTPHVLGIGVGLFLQIVAVTLAYTAVVGAFQAVNPKAWVMVLNVAFLFGPGSPSLVPVLVLAASAAAINLPCVSVWAVAGDRLRRLLLKPRAGRIFNVVMATLMAVTAVWLLVEEFLPH